MAGYLCHRWFSAHFENRFEMKTQKATHKPFTKIINNAIKCRNEWRVDKSRWKWKEKNRKYEGKILDAVAQTDDTDEWDSQIDS